MIVYTLPTRHRPLLRAGNPTSGDHFRLKCGLLAKSGSLSFCRHQFSHIPSSQKLTLSPMAVGSNVSEDTDDTFDDLSKSMGRWSSEAMIKSLLVQRLMMMLKACLVSCCCFG